MEGKTIDYLINEQIRDKEVRVIGSEGNQLGVMSVQDARKIAEEAGLDLVRVSPNAKPPVCKIIDYGKFRYEISRKEKEAKKKQKIVEIKEVRLSPNIEENDMNTKVNQARKFLAKGNRVKVTLRFRGRELAYVNQNKPMLDDFAERLSDIADITDNGSEIAALLIFEHQIKTVPASCRQDCLTAISTKFNRQIGIFG